MGRTTFYLLEQEQKRKEKEKKKVEVKTFKPDKKGVDYEEEIKKYHTGGGWYDLPGSENKLRKDDAIAALKESDQ